MMHARWLSIPLLCLAPLAASWAADCPELLQGSLPKSGRSWGLARKLLNIFLRDSLYTGYLNKAYGLRAAERFLEIPLDSITAERIRERMPELPRWPGVRHLGPELSAAYQAAALRLAAKQGVRRVHLDAYWWGQRGARH